MVNATDPLIAFSILAWDKKLFRHKDILPDVVFIGDSNYAVSLFAGNGANTASVYGWDLTGFLEASDSMESAVAAYNKVSVPRMQKTLTSSH